MSIKKIILEKIPKKELSKLNVMSFYLKSPESSTMKTFHERLNATSSFHNSKELTVGGFYKHTSLLIGAIYEEHK